MIVVAILFGEICSVFLAQALCENGYHIHEFAVRIVTIVWTVYMISLI